MFGDKLKYLREHQEMSQMEAANRLGIMQNTYSRYERGIREPNYSTLKKIANFYGVSIDYLLDNDDIETMEVIDLNKFILESHYTVEAKFPTVGDRKMLYNIVKAVYTNKLFGTK